MCKLWGRIPALIITIFLLMGGLGSVLNAGVTGKISGVVKDAGTGEALAGANVVIVGTTMGASTDLSGRYFILNVPVGVYAVKVTMMGYTSVTKTDVKVSVDLTSEVNFSLATTVIEGEAVTVVAERPLVEKTLTQSKTTIDVHELNHNLPVANINDIIQTAASTYKGYVRGGRKYETKTLIDGVDVSDTYFSGGTGAFGGGDVGHTYQGFRRSELDQTTMSDVPSGAIQELNVYAGTFTAEYPTASAGIINIVTKTGGKDYHGKIFARMTPLNTWEHFGDNVYWMRNDQTALNPATGKLDTLNIGYFTEKAKWLKAGTTYGKRAAELYTWNEDLARDQYYYDPKDSVGLGRSYDIEGNLSGPIPFLGDKAGFFLSAHFLNTRTSALPFDIDKRFISSLKLHYDLDPAMRLSLYGQLEDGGKLFNFVNWKFNPKWAYFMEGAPRYKDLSYVGYAKWTHTLSAKTFYEVQISHNAKNDWIGYPDDNKDGYCDINEKGDFIQFKDLDEYLRYVGGVTKTDTIRDAQGNILSIETYADLKSLTGYMGNWYAENKDVVLPARDPNRAFFYQTVDPASGVNEAKPNFWKVDGWYRTHYPPPLYSKTLRNVTTFKADFTSQLNFNHQLKSGLQFRYHNVDVDHKQSELGGNGRQYPYALMHVDIHKFNPKEFAFYLQDRIEYSGLIVNVGARIDGYDTDTRNFVNDFHPWSVVYYPSKTLKELEPVRGDKVGWKWYFSPRIGISHPVSNTMAMHYSFGKFIQYPNFASLYQDYNFTDYAASPSIYTKWVDQEPMRATSYEMGLQYSPFSDIVLDGTVYYRDVENYASALITLTPYAGQGLYIETSWGHADSRGIEVSVEKRPSKWWAGRVTYAYSYIKVASRMAGTEESQRLSFSSKVDSAKFAGLPLDRLNSLNYREENVTVRGSGTSNRNALAGGYDRTHRFAGTLMLYLPYGVELSAVSELTSGFKYWPTENIDNDPFFNVSPKLREGPWNFWVNTRLTLNPLNLLQDAGALSKNSLGGMNVRLFAEIRNLTNHKNILAYNNTPFMEATDQRIFEIGRDFKANTGDEEDPQGYRKIPHDTLGRLLYGPARQIWAGLEFSF